MEMMIISGIEIEQKNYVAMLVWPNIVFSPAKLIVNQMITTLSKIHFISPAMFTNMDMLRNQISHLKDC